MAVFRGVWNAQTLRMDTQVCVTLPKDPAERTMILLHGLGGTCEEWMTYSSVARYAEQYRCALVMPQVQRSFYTDMARGLDYFSYIADELPELIARAFRVPTDEKRLCVGGLSMGGFGAMKCALTYPARYAGCASLSARYFLDNRVAAVREKQGERGLDEWRGIVGESLTAPPADDIFALIERAAAQPARPLLYLACGTEDHLYGENIAVRDRLRERGFAHRYEEWPGLHRWDFWDHAIERAMEYLFTDEA